MIKYDNIDKSRRTTLKAFAGVTAAGLLGNLPAVAGIHNTGQQYKNPAKFSAQSIDATIISRADASRNYLLMHNKSGKDIAISRFTNQIIHFDDTVFNMADAYVEPIVVRSNDRVMVRLLIDNTIHPVSASANSTNLNGHLKYLLQGTRVVEVPVNVMNAVATINHNAFNRYRFT